jgi:hypothetical protein
MKWDELRNEMENIQSDMLTIERSGGPPETDHVNAMASAIRLLAEVTARVMDSSHTHGEWGSINKPKPEPRVKRGQEDQTE